MTAVPLSRASAMPAFPYGYLKGMFGTDTGGTYQFVPMLRYYCD
jgi:hypothetical protein